MTDDALKIFGAVGGWVIAIIVALFAYWNIRRTKQREIDATPYELITEWLRRVDAKAFDYYQKASENDEAWIRATHSWEELKAEFNWVMGLVKSLDTPSPLYELIGKHYDYLLAYERLAQDIRSKRIPATTHEVLQTQLHISSGTIYKELRNRR